MTGQSPLPPWQLFLRFLRFGLLAWGGPVAQIAMVRRELVDEEGWLSSGRFNRLLAIYQVLPGPEAHELCVHMGMIRGGRLGGILAGLGFMAPGFILMMAVSWLYFSTNITTFLGPAFLGVQVTVIALIVLASQRIGRHILTDWRLWLIGIAAAIASFLGVPFWITLPIAGLVYMLGSRRPIVTALLIVVAVIAAGAHSTGFIGAALGMLAPAAAAPIEPSPVALFLSGLKAGLLTFGGAYTAVPFLRADAVGSGWMTDARFLDGLALSGILPAPLIIFSTFVGYAGGGPIGALAMTVGIFLPAFSFSLLFFDRLESILHNTGLQALLEGVAAGVVGLIVATTVDLAATLTGRLPSLVPGALIFVLAVAILVAWKSRMSTPLAIALGGLTGWIFFGGAPPLLL